MNAMTIQTVEVIIQGMYMFLGFIAGAAIGSGYMCFVARNVRGESWMEGRSHCDTCGHTLNWIDLIPVFGYIIRGGKCHYCGQKIPISSFLTEILYGVLCSLLVYSLTSNRCMEARCVMSVTVVAIILAAGFYAFQKEKKLVKEGAS